MTPSLPHLPEDRPSRAALGASAVGVVLMMLGWWHVGLLALIGGWLVLAVTDRRWLTICLIGTVPLTTFGWTAEITTISGRVLDVRLVVTFAVAGISAVSLFIARSRPTRTEVVFALLIAWSIVSGLLAADSLLTWGPPIARLVTYAAVFALARRHLVQPGDLRLAMAVAAIAFVIPTTAGLVTYVLGGAEMINDATRATTPGGRGPISLAFAGQVALATGFALHATRRNPGILSSTWLAVSLVGGAGLLASATRLVTVTAWLVVGGFAALRGRWRTAALITVLFAAAFLARPDLLGRFIGTVAEPTPSQGIAKPGDTGSDVELDASARFRIFVWGAILEEWSTRPITGIGPGMTARVVAERSPAERAAPHNDYVGVFAELSLPGLALFLVLQGLVITELVHRIRRQHDPGLRDQMRMTALLFVGVNVLGAINNPMYFFDLQVAIWALAGAASFATAADGRSGRSTRGMPLAG